MRLKNMKNLTTPNQYAFEDKRPTITAKPNEHLTQGFSAEDFQRIMLETVDDTFSSLGKRAKKSIYFHLKNSFGTTRENIPGEIEKFATALKKIFGPGAQLLEIQIMKRLHKKIGTIIKYYPKQKNLTFVDYLETTRILLSICTSVKRPMPDEYYDYKFC
jgi:hypothetical protein